ncbi:MAG TPA: SRPBCC domain-containing protein [Chitinophagales bacterium]|nr:SRPBCC domain-containing protein [Chitinophagales bacterium]
MKELRTEIKINASPEKIWKVLTDFEKYPQWNPMIKSFKGNLEEGQKVTVKLEQPGSSGMTFKPTITKVVANHQFRWQGHLFFPGLFDGEHLFEIKDNKDGTCTFIHGENFKGILIPLSKKMLENNTRRGFEMMNEKLRE